MRMVKTMWTPNLRRQRRSWRVSKDNTNDGEGMDEKLRTCGHSLEKKEQERKREKGGEREIKNKKSHQLNLLKKNNENCQVI